METLYNSFEKMLLSYNFGKTKELMRSLKDMKLLEKVDQKELAMVLNNPSHQKLWQIISTVPYATIKSKICNSKTFSVLISNSCTFSDTFREKEWMHLYQQANMNKKDLLDYVSYKDISLLKVDEKYEAKSQNLPFDSLNLEHSTIVTPLNNTFLSAVSDSFKLCTYANKDNIGPNHQKMFVFDDENKVIAVLTIYSRYNCFAVSGKSNSRIRPEIETEIKDALIKNGLLKANPYLIDNSSDFSTVNQDEHHFDSHSAEHSFRMSPDLVRTMFPDIEEKIATHKESMVKKEQEEKQKMEAELKDLKDKILAKLADPNFLQMVQSNLIQQVHMAESGWQLRSLEDCINELTIDPSKAVDEKSMPSYFFKSFF